MTLRIDAGRLWADLMTMGAIGETPGGGSYRPALSDADREGRNLFRHWAQELGLRVSVDGIGNIFAQRDGVDASLPPVMIGSHLDTQMPGGKFDGVLGVLAGLAVVRALNEAGVKTRHPIEIVNWTNEEGARFQPGIMGSSLFAGRLDMASVLSRRDAQGVKLEDELLRIGQAGTAEIGGRPVHRYLELHIEQGPELERTATDIGAVVSSSYMCSGYITVHGENGHTQTTAMSARRSALNAAAKLILAIDEIGAAEEPDGMVSVSTITNWPNNRVNIPHRTELAYAVVHLEEEGRSRITERIAQAVARVRAENSIEIELEHRHFWDRQDFTPGLVSKIEALSAELGLSARSLKTLTAHDALSMIPLCPTALIFVPCRGGVSHSEKEWSEPGQVAAGADVLLNLALSEAGQAG